MNRTNRKQRQRKAGRLNIVAKYFKAGLSYTQIAMNVYEITGFKPSKSAICRDVKTLLLEWREEKIKANADLTTLELARIDEIVAVLWDEWDKSRALKPTVTTKTDGIVHNSAASDSERVIKTVEIQETQQIKEACGDVRYIAEIRKQLQERRNLLGLYSADVKNIKTYILSSNHYLYAPAGRLHESEKK